MNYKKLIAVALFVATLAIAMLVANNMTMVAINIYNGIAVQYQGVKEAVGALDAQYQRRHALIGNLVKITKESKDYEKYLVEIEKDVLVKTAMAKASATKMDVALPEGVKDRIKAENSLGGLLVNAMDKLMVQAQHYPTITDPKIVERTKAFEALSQLREELKVIEGDIMAARNVLNQRVNQYNSSVTMFPGNLIANWGHFRTMDYFESIDKKSNEDPEIKF